MVVMLLEPVGRMVVLAVLQPGRIALRVESDAEEAATVLCRTSVQGRASTFRRPHTSTSVPAETSMWRSRGEISRALLRAAVFLVSCC